MWQRIVFVVFMVVVLGSGGFFLYQKNVKPHAVHYHAGFQVYVDDKLQNFSDWKYMHERPCTVDGKPVADHHEDEQIEKAHLHDQTGDVVHVHRQGATWKDLFVNIKYPIETKSIVFINGRRVESFLDKPIEPYESVVIFLGKHHDDKKYLEKAVTKEHILQVEKKSETCGATN